MQKKIQSLYREKKRKRIEMDDMHYMEDYSDIEGFIDNKIGRIILKICVVLGIFVFLLNVFWKEFQTVSLEDFGRENTAIIR